jgi:hypothetical protein
MEKHLIIANEKNKFILKELITLKHKKNRN